MKIVYFVLSTIVKGKTQKEDSKYEVKTQKNKKLCLNLVEKENPMKTGNRRMADAHVDITALGPGRVFRHGRTPAGVIAADAGPADFRQQGRFQARNAAA